MIEIFRRMLLFLQSGNVPRPMAKYQDGIQIVKKEFNFNKKNWKEIAMPSFPTPQAKY